jgi:hypothetical protein
MTKEKIPNNNNNNTISLAKVLLASSQGIDVYEWGLPIPLPLFKAGILSYVGKHAVLLVGQLGGEELAGLLFYLLFLV